MSEFLELASRVEAAMGADREIDALIWCIVSPAPETYTAESWFRNDPKPAGMDSLGLDLRGLLERFPQDIAKMADSYNVPKFTASLDAALTLMPENHIHAIFYLEDGIKVQMWDRTRGDYCGFGVDISEATAATYALTLTAAALKARAGVMS